MQDIRSWLQPKNKKVEPKKRKIEDDDDDIIPGSPDVQVINKKSKSRSSTQTSKGKNKSSSNKPLKEVKVTDLFGNAPIKRTEPIVKKSTKKTETGIHSDDDFEKSLLEIDDLEQIESKVPEISDKHKAKSESQNKVHNHEESSAKGKSNEHKSCKSTEKSRIEVVPSTSKTNDKLSNSKKVEDIKREIKETNKRKFTEFIDSDNEHDSNKKVKVESGSATVIKNGDTVKTEIINVTTNDSLSESYDESKSKKERFKSHNESVLTDEERHERKMYSAKLYQSYLNRSGPKNLGAKEMPEGATNCFKDFAFLLTGVMDSFEREDVIETITKLGGCIKNSISKKVTHVLAGEDAGPAKMAKAQELGIKILNEDEFLKLIKESNTPKPKTEPNEVFKKGKHKESSKETEKEKKKSPKDKHLVNGHKTEKSDIHKEKSERKHNKDSRNTDKKEQTHKDHSKDKLEVKERNRVKSKSPSRNTDKKEQTHKDHSRDKLEVKERNHVQSKSSTKDDVVVIKKDLKWESTSKSSTDITENNAKADADIIQTSNVKSSTHTEISGTMWVEKYKPQTVKQIIGQQGEASNVNKLINWLMKWYVNRKAKLPKPSPWAKNDDGGYYKAALLSGPPGVGKTTTVALVCKQLGFDMVEFNASDTRNKTLIKEQIGELLTTTSLSAYAKGDTGKQAVTKKHVLVMDEVDGMAGNEDRGGLQELIGLIKSTSVPIICMCNDRNSQKMRSLVNYCYDLRFNRPRIEQIKAAMRSVCCKENIKIPPDVLGQLIASANQDVRQTLNLLSMWAIDPSLMDPDKLSKDAAVTKKDIKLGPWEAIRKVFSEQDHKTMSINDKSDLFFYDYSLAPLFVQENYLQVQPHCPKHEVLQRISQAADSIAYSDTIEKRIRSNQAWSLLPMQAMYSSVLPGHYLSGHMTGQIQFPGWLGKNSRANKMHRLCQEIHAHTRLSTTGSKSSIFLDYSVHLRDAIVTPMIKDHADGIDRSLEVMQAYNLMREDLDSLVELSLWPGQRNPTVLIDSKVKAAMTRMYNKRACPTYAPVSFKRGKAQDDDDVMEEDAMDVDDEVDSDPENDVLIKKKKSQLSEKSHSSGSEGRQSSNKGKSSKGSSSSKGKKK